MRTNAEGKRNHQSFSGRTNERTTERCRTESIRSNIFFALFDYLIGEPGKQNSFDEKEGVEWAKKAKQFGKFPRPTLGSWLRLSTSTPSTVKSVAVKINLLIMRPRLCFPFSPNEQSYREKEGGKSGCGKLRDEKWDSREKS